MTNEDKALEIKRCYLNLLNQACGEFGPGHEFKGYDSMYLSAYENALELAVELGWIKKEEVLR